jgi:hypothetical protein
MSSRRKSEARAEATSAAAYAIIGAEKAKHDAKTARLRKARLQKEAAGLLGECAGQAESKEIEGEREELRSIELCSCPRIRNTMKRNPASGEPGTGF